MQTMRASRVGVYTERPVWAKGEKYIPCDRCGAGRVVHGHRQVLPLCRDCRSSDPLWGTVPFEQLPVDDSNVCAFESSTNRKRKGASRALPNREDNR